MFESWEDARSRFRLMKGADGYILATPNPNTGYATYYHHPDLKVMRKYATDVVGLVIPEF